MAYGAHFLKNVLNGSISPKPMQGFALHIQKLGQLVGLLVWCGQREK
jgi:hypothetical protein